MTKSIAWGWLFVALSLPAYAQEEIPAETAAAEEAAPAADESAAADSGTAADDSASAGESGSDSTSDSASSEDSSGAEDTASDDSSGDGEGGGRGLNLYVGLEFDQAKVDLDDRDTSTSLGRSRFDTDFYKIRLGARVFEGVGIEFHAGVPSSNASDRKLEMKQFYGLYLVPTGVIMETVEVSARLGYAYVKLDSEQGSDDADGASFGLALEVPLRRFGENLPNVRIGGGGTVYQEQREGRIYGYHFGLRYDFSL